MKLKLIIGLSFALALVFFAMAATAQNQDANPYGGIYYNDHSNYRMYGANGLPRTDHTNLDTLTNVLKGDLRFDTLNSVVVVYDGTAWVDLSSSSSGWSTTGNAGTDTASNYLGTTDAEPFAIKTNGTQRMLFDEFGNSLITKSDAHGSISLGTTENDSVVTSIMLFTGSNGRVVGSFLDGAGLQLIYMDDSGVTAHAGALSDGFKGGASGATYWGKMWLEYDEPSILKSELVSDANQYGEVSITPYVVSINADSTEINGALSIVDGTQSEGYVLTSDASGNASWETTAGNGNTLDGAYDQGGAGLGRDIDAVDGAVKISGEDGFIVTGTFGSGADSEWVGGGSYNSGMFFNPNKAAFRAGRPNASQWDNVNIGDYSIAMGESTTASGANSTAIGDGTVSTGAASISIGITTIATGDASTAMGQLTTASGTSSFSSGYFTAAKSYSETAIGIYNTSYTPTSTSAWNATDRLFVIGNGQTSGTRSDALVMLKNGNTGLGTSTPDTTLHLVGQLKYEDGNESDGAILVSDADGVASWDVPSFGEMGFGDSTRTIALTQNVPAWATNVGNNLWETGALQLSNGVTYSNDSLIVTTAGIYFVEVQLTMDGSTGSTIELSVYKNGAEDCFCTSEASLSNNKTFSLTYTDITDVAANDVFQVYVENIQSNSDIDVLNGKIIMHRLK